MSKLRDRRLRPVLLFHLACCSLVLALSGCPDDIASTDLAAPKDQGAAVQDLGKKD